MAERPSEEEHFRALVETTSDWLWEVDEAGVYTYASPSVQELLGYPPSEVVGKTPFDFMPREEAERVRELFQPHLERPMPLRSLVNLNRHRDGRLLWLETRAVPVVDAEGKLIGYRGVDRDVTDRVRAEEHLKRANQELRLISATNYAVIHAKTEQELLGEVCRIAMKEGGYDFAWIGLHDEQERADERGREFGSVISLPLPGDEGSLGTLNVCSRRQNAFDERAARLLAQLATELAFAISAHRARRRTAELEAGMRNTEKLQAVGQLAGGIAHDFNSYLTVVMSLTDLLLADPTTGDRQREDLREIRGMTERCAKLTRQLLTFSRQQPVRARPVDVNEAVSSALALVRTLLGERVTVRLDLARNAGKVLVDPGHLEQVLMNLVVNARDAMPDGGTLEVATRPAGQLLGDKGFLQLVVSDTGCGMDEATRSHVFEPFFTTKAHGTGLGLSTVYGIVQQNGGSIRVDSAPGQGTRFSILLPLAATDSALASSTPPPGPTLLQGTEQLLLVEDEAVVRRAAVRILQRNGYRILEASCVREALEVTDSTLSEIDLLVTDMGLPDGDGRQVADALSQRRPQLRVLFTSGYVATHGGSAPNVRPDEHFLPKPFAAQSLLRAVRGALTGGAPS